MRVFIYCRVSTPHQVKSELSIPAQRREMENHSRAQGWTIANVYVEGGRSATDDNRPVFRQMLDAAMAPDHPVDAIVVHSFSRFYRDHCESEFLIRRLEKKKIKVISVSQPLSDDPAATAVRQIIQVVDGLQSRENAHNTLRAMKENARQGFWNGAPPPLGYRSVPAEQRGDRIKKKLEVDPTEAKTVRLVFHLYLKGDGTHGPMGVKKIVGYLNSRGITTRSGGKFGVKTIHDLLTRTAYIGTHEFNRRDAKTGELKDRSEWISMAVPAIISKPMFARVQKRLRERDPCRALPRVAGSPCLLTGVLKCANCGKAMTLATGKSGQYRYYACSGHGRYGTAVCQGQRIPMAKLDDAVLDAAATRLLPDARVQPILDALIADIRQDGDSSRSDHRAALAELRRVEGSISTHYDLVTQIKGAGDDKMLRKKFEGLLSRKRDLEREIADLGDRINRPEVAMTMSLRSAMADAIRDQFLNGSVSFQKAYLALFVDRIELSGTEVLLVRSSKRPSRAAARVATYEEVPGERDAA